MIRDEFEKLFPVPLHVVWNPAQGAYTSGSHFFSDIAEAYQGAWVGFQAGHAAGLEAGAKVADANWHYETAAAIRAMKP